MLVETDLQCSAPVEKFISFLCSELNINPTRITIGSFCNDGSLGLCIDETETDFIILVKEQERDIGEIFTTIAHEMIHVKQYMQENLGWFLDNRSYIPYSERWWEEEAFAMSVPLVEKFAKTLQHIGEQMNILIFKDVNEYRKVKREDLMRSHIAGYWQDDGRFAVCKNRLGPSPADFTQEELNDAIEKSLKKV